MKGPIKWMTTNHVAANLLMMLFVVGGIVVGTNLMQELFPEFNLDMISISVPYPGSSPEEVEEGILLKIEDRITGMNGIKRITASAVEGLGTVTVELRSGADAHQVLQNIKNEIDRIVTFPAKAEKAVVSKVLAKQEVISVVVYGNISDRSLRERAEAIREALLSRSQITQVHLAGVKPYEISVEISEENLRRYNLTLEQVASILNSASLNLPGGKIKTKGGEILLRTKGQYYTGKEFEALPIIAGLDGATVRLGDIATVKDTFAETDLQATFNGESAAVVKIFRVGDQKPMEISRLVHEYVRTASKTLPQSVKMAVWNDNSEYFSSRMTLLSKNAISGLFLVIIILGLFLEIRLAFWVMLGVPISLLGALFIFPALDVSINMISLFGFILALGILVDDAIVVGESIFTHRQQGKSWLKASLDGALEVGKPVTFGVLTTVAAFLPLCFVTGSLGQLLRPIPLVVISLLLISLIESLFILPAHLSHANKNEDKKDGGILRKINRIHELFGAHLDKFIAGPFSKLIFICVRNRYVTLSTSVTLMLLLGGLFLGGHLKFAFMPKVTGNVIRVSMKMPSGTPLETTQEVQAMVVEKAMAVVAEIDRMRPGEPSIFKGLYAITGSLAEGFPSGVDYGTASGSNVASAALQLSEGSIRNYPIRQIKKRWQEKVGELPGVDSLVFSYELIRLEDDINIQIAHTDYDVLAEAVSAIRRQIKRYPGVGEIEDSYNKGKKELNFKLTAEARAAGITEAELARQIRAAYYGAEALRLQLGRNEVKVMVRYPASERRELYSLNQLRIRPPGGGEMPLRRAAVMTEGRGYASIRRVDRKRVVNLTAAIEPTVGNAKVILKDLNDTALQKLRSEYPDISFKILGAEQERGELVRKLGRSFAIALFAIYALMAIPFKSYFQPLIIMSAVPFGIVGAVIGHMLFGYSISMMSLFGLVPLAGVVVNDSLLLVDQINTKRRSGTPAFYAAIFSATRRFRPIVLTSLTTFVGLLPIMFETSVQAQYLIPMSLSMAFGIVFATAITLLLIPSLYLALEDLSSKIRSLLQKKKPTNKEEPGVDPTQYAPVVIKVHSIDGKVKKVRARAKIAVR